MDDPNFDTAVVEIIKFYRAITVPFLNRMPDSEKEKAIIWSQKVMDLKHYDSLVKYLIFLTFMIINGRLVSPFDSDPFTSQIPSLPVHFGEDKMLEYVEKVAAQCQASVSNESNDNTSQSTKEPTQIPSGQIQTALSNDEMAFLATQPVPGVGIRLYMATSAQPFAMWSKPEAAPKVIKYNAPAKEVVDRGVSIAKEKFYSYLEEIESKKNQNQATQKDDSHDTKEDISHQSVPASRAVAQEPIAEPSRVTPSTTPATPICTTQPLTSQSSTRPKNYLPRPAEPLTKEQKRQEAEIEAKSRRWFPSKDYDRYREHIKGFLRGGMSVDTLRRSLHKIMRENYKNITEIPVYLYDSMDESFPMENRISHLRLRYMDALEKEYGITNEAELYYLAGLAGMNEYQMEKARRLIHKAEEGLVDPTFKERVQATHGRSCARLMSLTEELLDTTLETSSETSHGNESSLSSLSDTCRLSRPSRRAARRRLIGMPPTSILRDNSEDTDDTSRWSAQNEPEPGYFRTMDESDVSQNSTRKSDQSFDITKEQPPQSFYNLPDTSQESNSEPDETDGSVYPYCPRENC